MKPAPPVMSTRMVSLLMVGADGAGWRSGQGSGVGGLEQAGRSVGTAGAPLVELHLQREAVRQVVVLRERERAARRVAGQAAYDEQRVARRDAERVGVVGAGD